MIEGSGSPTFDPIEYKSWAQCRVGSFVVIETITEMPFPNMEAFRAIAEDRRDEAISDSMVDHLRAILPSGVIRTVMEITSRLIKITTDWVKIQIEMKAILNGTPMTSEVIRTIAAKPEQTARVIQTCKSEEPDGSFAEVVSIPFRTSDAEAPASEGEEQLMIAGQELTCRWTEQSLEFEGKSFWSKIWRSESIPGGLAKYETKIGVPPEQSSRMMVTSFERR